MGWIKKVFGNAPDEPSVVVIQSGESRSDQALCVKLDGAYIIDLSPLPPDPDRVVRAIKQVADTIEQSPQAIQVWVASTRLLAAFSDNTDALMNLTDALFAATKSVEPKIMVESDAPEGVVYILGSLGFEVFLPGLRLTAVDSNGRASEIDVEQILKKLKAAKPLEV